MAQNYRQSHTQNENWAGAEPSLLAVSRRAGDLCHKCGGRLALLSTRPAFMVAVWGLVVWLSGNALASINVVALRQTRLVLGWVTICGQVNHFGM